MVALGEPSEIDDLAAWLRLALTPGIGNTTARKLLAEFGSAPAIFAQGEAALRQLGTERLAAALRQEPEGLAEQVDRTFEWLASGDDRRIVCIGDPDYPAALLDTEDPPLMLYLLGALADPAALGQLNAANCLAIVGSRNPTPQGAANAREFARSLGGSGQCIVSGLALGIDGAAHEGALLGGGTTIAVVGTGLDRVYPRKHLELAHQIAERGMLVSEFPLGTPALTSNFPKRNRIISGLAQGTLVVEAAVRSGSLITARLAVEQGKDVFAIPGSIHSPQSKGCHLLIKQGAKLVESAQDVLEELKLPTPAAGSGASTADFACEDPAAASAEDAVLRAMGFDPVSVDAIQSRTGLSTPALQAQLLTHELAGHLARMPGGLFQRIAHV
ncbi:MAG: DNA-processing protein DprA [Pseudomonadota bacterium]